MKYDKFTPIVYKHLLNLKNYYYDLFEFNWINEQKAQCIKFKEQNEINAYKDNIYWKFLKNRSWND
jgi:hypothetical protein